MNVREITVTVQRTTTRWTYRSVPGPEAPGPLREGPASPVGPSAHEDGIVPDKVRAIREIQSRLPHERRNAVSGPSKGNPAPDRRPLEWWRLGDDI